VTDLDTPIVDDPSAADTAEHPAGRRLRRRRGLPGGRAVVGALLVAGSAVGIAAAHLQASAAPSTSYLVADQPIAPGTRFATLEEVLAVVGRSAIDLPPTVAARALPLEEADALVGHVVVAPLERGDLVTRTAVVADGGVAGARTLSFALPAVDAVAGSLRPGERIDVVASYATGADAYTGFVVRGVPLVGVAAVESGLGGGAGVTLTVAVTALDDVLALSHAIATADLRVVRTASGTDAADPAPGSYRPEPVDAGPAPDPAPDPVMSDPAPAPVEPSSGSVRTDPETTSVGPPVPGPRAGGAP
jgi:hypothetical protein